MPNRRENLEQGALERAHPWPAGRFAEPEPQERRGAPGSRGGSENPAEPGRRQRAPHQRASDWKGVDPKDPIDESMPRVKPGDQGG